jgi:hypothetical protein
MDELRVIQEATEVFFLQEYEHGCEVQADRRLGRNL